MNAIPGDGPLGYVGDTSGIDPNFRNTTVAQIMLEADYNLKYDQFGSPSNDSEREMKQDWIWLDTQNLQL